MQLSAQQAFKDLDEGRFRPFYVVVGEEPFQTSEILLRLKRFFLKGENQIAFNTTFNYETWDGEHLNGADLLTSLNTVPGLFDGPDSLRLVTCSRFDKVSASALEALDPYFRNPSPTTCFVLLCNKVDKRKSWYKKVDEKGAVIDVNEPYEREWPRWHGYFEKKI
jgi:DNA polymerase III subunit delta